LSASSTRVSENTAEFINEQFQHQIVETLAPCVADNACMFSLTLEHYPTSLPVREEGRIEGTRRTQSQGGSTLAPMRD